MVVIVIRVPTRDGNEDKPPSTVGYQSGGGSGGGGAPKVVTVTRKICETETGPPSYDSGVNIDAEPRDVKLFLRESRTATHGCPYRRDPEHDAESCSKDSGFGCYSEYHRLKDLELLREIHERSKNEIRLESPASKDSGFSDLKSRPSNVTTIKYSALGGDPRERVATCTYLSSRSSQPDTDSNTVTYLSCSSQADPENSVATTKEEEWVTKKKVELTTTRQIETRVKRQVILEDGKVVEDSGPIVTTNTTEDTEKQEHNQTEHRTIGDDPPSEEWVAPVRGGLVKEVKERTVKTREETEERLETEDVQHLGDISDEGYMKAVKSGQSDVRQALESSSRKELVSSSPKIIHQSSRTRKTIDTDDKQESSEIQTDGKVITETKITTEHEEVCDANVPDDDEVDSHSLDESTTKESFQRFRKTKEADVTEYRADGVKIGQKVHHQAETSEGERYGEPIDFNQMESLSTRLRRMRLRSQNHKLALEGGSSSERKDVLTKRPLNFDQEEETRKVETSKWLEHHFGSESTKSSKGSQDDLADVMPPNQNSFINVTMTSRPIRGRSPKTISFSDEDTPPKNYYAKTESPREIFISSPECDSPPNSGYFRGIGHWDSRRTQETKAVRSETKRIVSPSSFQRSSPPPESPPLVITSHRINPLKPSYSSSSATKQLIEESSPLVERRRFTQTNGTSYPPRNSTPVRHDIALRERSPSPSPIQRNLMMSSPEEEVPSPPARRNQKETSRVNYDIQSWDKRQKSEERGNHVGRSPSPIEDEIIVREEVMTVELPSNKKLYQRTRFAADIPPQPQQARSTPPPPPPTKQKSKIGESLRKFVGKLRSTSTERRGKKRNGKNSGSRSPSPKNTYQNYSVVDNNIPSAVNRVGRDQMGEPVAPPRGRPSKWDNGSLVDSGTQTKVPGGMERKLTQRYYLGEDPFSGSIYGREREYDGVVPMKTRGRAREAHRAANYRRSDDEIQPPSTLGRLSKSTSRLISSEMRSSTYDHDREVQTLPRKLRNEGNHKKPVEAQRSLGETRTLSPNHWEYTQHNSKPRAPTHGGSMINVSFVNHVAPPSSKYTNGVTLNGPAKPARTYRSNLSRSKSFNVQIGEGDYGSSPYKSNPQLHRLEESPEPLKSPRIISSLNRSSRDITEEGFAYPRQSEDKRRVFMKGLMERAPELFRTLHGDEEEEPKGGPFANRSVRRTPDSGDAFRASGEVPFRKTTALANGIDRSSPKSSIISNPSFKEITTHDGNTTKSIVRRGSSSNDDYSETVRITSKSDDPLRPSETNTVQTFTKKTIPSRNGLATETIQSSETKTVVKSRYLGGEGEGGGKFYRSSPGGVTIEVRNHRK